jgi:single-strand DNA-binding protein
MELCINSVAVLGKVGDHPHFTTTKEGVPYATLSVATHGTYTDKNGDKQGFTEWIHCEFYSTLCEVIKGLALQPNDTVYVTGELRTKKYICKQDGVQKFLTTVKAHRISVDVSGDRCKQERE